MTDPAEAMPDPDYGFEVAPSPEPDPYPSSEEVDCAVIAQLRQQLAEAANIRLMLEARVATLTLGLETEQALHEQTNADRLEALARVATLTQERDDLKSDKAFWSLMTTSDRAEDAESRLALLSVGVQQIEQEMREELSKDVHRSQRQSGLIVDWGKRLHALTESKP